MHPQVQPKCNTYGNPGEGLLSEETSRTKLDPRRCDVKKKRKKALRARINTHRNEICRGISDRVARATKLRFTYAALHAHDWFNKGEEATHGEVSPCRVC